MKHLQNVLYVWFNEFRTALFDEGVVVFFIVVPLLYPLLYAYLYNNEQVRDVPTVVVDNSRSVRSRDFLRRADATADIKIVGHCADMSEAVELIRQHKAYCLIYIPAEFSKNIEMGEQAVVELYADMSGVLYYKAVYSACTEVSLDMNFNIKTLRMAGMTDEQAEIFSQPIQYQYTSLFNTQSGFATFLIPAVLILIIQQTMVLGVGMIVGNEREIRRKCPDYQFFIGKNPKEILLGKSLAYFIFYVFISIYLVTIVPSLFHLIHIGQLVDLAAFMLPFLLACVFFSITLSYLSFNREVFIIMFVFMSLPLLFMSGISWPASSIPTFWKVFSWIFPSTFGINGFIRIGSMGAVINDVRPEFIGLWVQTVVYFFTALWVCKRNYSNYHLLKFAECLHFKHKVKDNKLLKLNKYAES